MRFYFIVRLCCSNFEFVCKSRFQRKMRESFATLSIRQNIAMRRYIMGSHLPVVLQSISICWRERQFLSRFVLCYLSLRVNVISPSKIEIWDMPDADDLHRTLFIAVSFLESPEMYVLRNLNSLFVCTLAGCEYGWKYCKADWFPLFRKYRHVWRTGMVVFLETS